VGIDATKGIIDIWAVFQVSWLALIALRAIRRLASAQTIHMPKLVRSIFRYAFILGLLFLASAVYSSSHSVSAAYSVIYFLTLICVVEFVVDSYKNPPDWIQCLLYLRLILSLLFLLVLITLVFNPILVMMLIPGVGIRLGGGTVAPVTAICPIIAIISAYTFLHTLETRFRSIFFFMVGLIGTLITQSRGSELALILSLIVLSLGWAKTSRRSAFFFISGFMAFILLTGAVMGAVGGEHIWNIFNRGQSLEGIKSASGRTDIWKFVIQYCLAHPQGMGYVAGFRVIFRQYFALGLQVNVSHIGNSHNSFMDILADAGWLALAVYLVMLVKIFALGLRFAKKRALVAFSPDIAPRHAIRCALVLLVFCMALGIDSADFAVPLRICFYMQNICIAIILGISASMISASRSQYIASLNNAS
jgi:O-antigen ligase